MLDGATALAIPTRFGQSLEVTPCKENGISWKSYDKNGELWFSGKITIIAGKLKSVAQNETSQTLIRILEKAKELNPIFLEDHNGYSITTQLEFPRDWGLGSSSTLINNIAQWAKVDGFTLLKSSFGGSGYDISIAQNATPILYKKEDGAPKSEVVSIHWDFLDRLFFVHLNEKQNSKKGIALYKKVIPNLIQFSIISAISHSLLACGTLTEFESLLEKHEKIISEIIQLPTVKERLFKDYPNAIKSLGAWGGDFILAVGDELDQVYFKKKGFKTILPFSDMIL